MTKIIESVKDGFRSSNVHKSLEIMCNQRSTIPSKVNGGTPKRFQDAFDDNLEGYRNIWLTDSASLNSN